MMRRLGGALLAVVALLATTLVGSHRPALAAGDCDGVQPARPVDGVGAAVPHPDGKFTPVVLVHGFISDPGIWSKPTTYSALTDQRPNVKRSLLGNLQALPGALVYPVDYRQTNTRWFTEPGAGGEVFTKTVDCIAGDSRFADHQVVVVAHSMGGLIARWAVTDAPGAAHRRNRTGLVVTVGTPYEGSWLAGLGAPVLDSIGTVAEGVVTAANAPLLDLLHLAVAACRDKEAGRIEPCGWLTRVIEFFASARAFAPGSSELGQLSAWPRGMRIETLASSAVVQDLGGLFLVRGPGTVDLGDLVVGRASARAGVQLGKTAECRFTTARLTTAVNGVLERAGMRLDTDTSTLIGLGLLGACLHIHQSVLLEHTAEILGAVAEELRRYDPIAKFVGTWTVHGEHLVVNADGTGTGVWNIGPCNDDRLCAGYATMRFTPVPDGLRATYVDVVFKDDTGRPPFDVGAEDDRAGKSYLITGVRPGLLHRKALGDLEPFSNPYLCGQGVSQADAQRC